MMSEHKKQFKTAEDYRDHLPCVECEPSQLIQSQQRFELNIECPFCKARVGENCSAVAPDVFHYARVIAVEEVKSRAQTWAASRPELHPLDFDAAPKVKRVPVDYIYEAVHPQFLKGLARIAAYAQEKYGAWDQYLGARLTSDKSPINHALEHIRAYRENEPHDKFGGVEWHLIAAAYNLMMEMAYFLKWGHPGNPFAKEKP